MLPAIYTLEEIANVTWTAALKGRQNARNGFRSSAVAYMEGLRQLDIDYCPASLRRLAADGARDIEHLLNGVTIFRLPNGGSAA